MLAQRAVRGQPPEGGEHPLDPPRSLVDVRRGTALAVQTLRQRGERRGVSALARVVADMRFAQHPRQRLRR